MIQIDFEKFHKSLSLEIISLQDRLRDIIGSANWGNDGAHKEAILKKIIQRVIPHNLDVTSGFVLCGDKTSTQIDILITTKNRPYLFNENGISVVNASCVRAIIEVKTTYVNATKDNVLDKLSDNALMIREAQNVLQDQHGVKLLTGFFSYDSDYVDDKTFGDNLVSSCKLDPNRCIDLAAISRKYFYISSQHIQNDGYDKWYSYLLPDLAFSYFVNNLVYLLLTDQVLDRSEARSWFPVNKSENGTCYLQNTFPCE